MSSTVTHTKREEANARHSAPSATAQASSPAPTYQSEHNPESKVNSAVKKPAEPVWSAEPEPQAAPDASPTSPAAAPGATASATEPHPSAPGPAPLDPSQLYFEGSVPGEPARMSLVHALNNLVGGPVFSMAELDQIADDLERERPGSGWVRRPGPGGE